jgi:hypothetical protein
LRASSSWHAMSSGCGLICEWRVVLNDMTDNKMENFRMTIFAKSHFSFFTTTAIKD